MKVLVTGGTGFIGTHLVDELVKRGEEVRSLVRETSDVRHLKKSGVELVYGDITDMDSLKKAVKGIDVVYHLVSGGSVSTISKEGYLKLRNLNVTGTKNLLKACSSSNIRKFLLFSSVSALSKTQICGQFLTVFKKRLIAAAFPCLFSSVRSFIRGSLTQNLRTISSVRSVQPLATTMILSIETRDNCCFLKASSNEPIFDSSL